MTKYIVGLIISVFLALFIKFQWLESWSIKSDSHSIETKPDWFFTRDIRQHSTKWGAYQVGYTDIDYEYKTNQQFVAGKSQTTINALGGRGPLPNTDKRCDDFRFVVVGDSFAFGRGVDDGHTFSDHLTHELRALEKKVSAYNFAVGGYAFWATIETILCKAIYVNPDAIFYVTYNNDSFVDGFDLVKEICDHLKIYFCVVYYPPFSVDEVKIKNYQRVVESIAVAATVDFYDLTQALVGKDKRELVAYDGHPSSLSHQLAAKWFSQKIPLSFCLKNRSYKKKRAQLLLKSLNDRLDWLSLLVEKQANGKKKEWIKQRIAIYQSLVKSREGEI